MLLPPLHPGFRRAHSVLMGMAPGELSADTVPKIGECGCDGSGRSCECSGRDNCGGTYGKDSKPVTDSAFAGKMFEHTNHQRSAFKASHRGGRARFHLMESAKSWHQYSAQISTARRAAPRGQGAAWETKCKCHRNNISQAPPHTQFGKTRRHASPFRVPPSGGNPFFEAESFSGVTVSLSKTRWANSPNSPALWPKFACIMSLAFYRFGAERAAIDAAREYLRAPFPSHFPTSLLKYVDIELNFSGVSAWLTIEGYSVDLSGPLADEQLALLLASFPEYLDWSFLQNTDVDDIEDWPSWFRAWVWAECQYTQRSDGICCVPWIDFVTCQTCKCDFSGPCGGAGTLSKQHCDCWRRNTSGMNAWCDSVDGTVNIEPESFQCIWDSESEHCYCRGRCEDGNLYFKQTPPCSQ